jgi:hypothetical protein
VAGNGRLVIAVGMIAVMIVALVVLLMSDGDQPLADPPTTVAPTTTTTAAVATTTTTAPAATTTSVDLDERVAEVEQILEDLELARLIAIYNKDESALPGIIAIQAGVDAAVEAMETLVFVADPAEAGIGVEVLEVLLDRPDCLVLYHIFDGRNALGPSATESAVRILWSTTDGPAGYRLARLWSSPSDLWQDDCDLMDRGEVSP